MANSHELNRDVDVDLGGIFGSIWRNKFKILFASLVVTALAFVLLQVISPRYRSEARILIQSNDSVLSSPATQSSGGNLNLDDPGIASQVQLLQSRTIAMKVARQLNLEKRPEFDKSLSNSPVDRILSMVGLSENGRGVTAEDRVLETYYEKLKVFQADRSRVIVVQFWSKDPKLAAAIPNMIAAEYLALQEELKRGANPAELDRLEPELKTLRSKVMSAEAAVAEYRENSDLLQGRDNNSLATQELSELSTELGRVRAQRSQAEANASSVRRALESGALDTAASVLQSPLIQRLRERQVTLNSQLSELSTTLLSGHPRIQRLRSQISALASQIKGEARKIESSLQQQANVARARESDLVQRQNQLKSEAGRVGKAQVELRALEREADAQRQLLNSYLVRFEEARSRQTREFLPADAYVFAKAEVQSKPYFPKKLPTLAGTFFGTFLLGCMISLATAILSGAAVSTGQRANPYAPVMDENGQYAAEDSISADHVRHQVPDENVPPLAPRQESFAAASQPQQMNTASGLKLLSASSVARSVKMLGKARIAVLTPQPVQADSTAVLARFLAADGVSVIVIDMTGNASSTKTMLGGRGDVGIRELMSGAVGFGDAIHCDRSSAAHIMPAGNAGSQAGGGNAVKLPVVLDALAQSYDYVIVDCGAADLGGLSKVSDRSTLNVINADDPHNAEVSFAADMIDHAGFRTPMIMVVNEQELQLMGLAAA